MRSVKRRCRVKDEGSKLKIVGIDDWSWRKGWTYGTIMVDLETHTVADVLPDRSSATTAAWLRQHPSIEVICRDRCGVFAQGAREGAPQARQVADRFHLLQNLRLSIERQMEHAGRVSVRARLSDAAAGLHPAPVVGGDSKAELSHDEAGSATETIHRPPDQRAEMFERVHELRKHGLTMRAIAAETGVGWFTVTRWIREGALPERARRVMRRTSPLFFHDFLSRQWSAGNRIGQHLLRDIRHRGYTGGRSNLERLLGSWRQREREEATGTPAQTSTCAALDPSTGWRIPPVTAAFLCMKPSRLCSSKELGILAALKTADAGFVEMRQLAMQFRGLLAGRDKLKLEPWLDRAGSSGLSSMERFVRAIRSDLDAVENAITERWSSGQVEGQVNRLKALKRSMYGRAGHELLRARLRPV